MARAKCSNNPGSATLSERQRVEGFAAPRQARGLERVEKAAHAYPASFSFTLQCFQMCIDGV
jgi:hypothetical protein